MSWIAFALIFAGALVGIFLRTILPQHHLSADSKDVVRLGTGLIATITALVLSLVIASAKNSYDTQRTNVRQMTANIILIDALLARYGTEAESVRILLRRAIPTFVDRIWHENSSDSAKVAPFEASAAADAFFDKIQELSPRNDAQRSFHTRAIQAANDLAQTRLLVFAQTDNSIPTLFLAVLIFWLAIIFVSFGLFAQPNATVIAALFISALSASASIFVILELTQPFGGLMMISSTPLRNALVPLSP